MAGKPEKDLMDERTADVTLEELREFLDADHIPVRANPEFRERLRIKLWGILQSRYPFLRSDDPD